MIRVRRAVVEDVDWLVEQAIAFFEFANYQSFYDPEYLPTLMRGLVADQFTIIAYDSDTGERMGMLAAAIAAHPYAPKKTIVSELCWWVPEEFRNTRAGLALLVTYTEWGKRNADWVTMCSLAHSPLKAESLRKHGFEPKESVFIWEKK